MPDRAHHELCPIAKELPPVASVASSKLSAVRTVQDIQATITNPAEMLMTASRKYGSACRVRVPMGPKLTYVTQYETFRWVVALRQSQAGMGGVLAQIPVISTWFRGSRIDPGSLEQLAVKTRSVISHLITPSRMREAGLASLAAQVTASASANWGDSVDLSTDLHPVVYEAVLRYLLGDELWAEFGSELVALYRIIVESADVKRIALSRTPVRYLLPEYRAAKRLGKLLPRFLEPRFADASPAVTEINRSLAARPDSHIDERAWMLMFLIWNGVSYSGSYSIWTLVDILSDPALRQRAQTAAGPQREELISRCLWETIRLHPLMVMTRKAKEPLVCPDGDRAYHIPAGEYVGAVITPLTMDEQRFPEPERYHPDRYLDTTPPFDLLYGRGVFGCVAQEFSRVVVATVLSELFPRYRMTLAGPVPDRFCRVHLTYPTSPIPIALHRRES